MKEKHQQDFPLTIFGRGGVGDHSEGELAMNEFSCNVKWVTSDVEGVQREYTSSPVKNTFYSLCLFCGLNHISFFHFVFQDMDFVKYIINCFKVYYPKFLCK